jgi:Signal transduction histidine kinase regulating citrate/malate metabolism
MPLLPDRHNDVTSRPELPEPCPELIWAAACRPSEAVTWRKIFPGTAEHVGDARRLTGVFLDDTPYADDAAWIVGELAANAVLHTRSGEPGGQYVLELRRTRRIARLTVCDLGGGGRPSFAPTVPGLPYAEHGYGLRTIAQLAARTGFRGNPAFGHAVWADLLLGG